MSALTHFRTERFRSFIKISQVAVAAFLVHASILQADTRFWRGHYNEPVGTGGLWNSPDFWYNGVPSNGDTAIFDLKFSGTIQLTAASSRLKRLSVLGNGPLTQFSGESILFENGIIDLERRAIFNSGIDNAGILTINSSVSSDSPQNAPILSHISGATSVVKTGSGDVFFSGQNAYSGSTTLSAGTLWVSSDQALGQSHADLIFKGGSLAAQGSFSLTRMVKVESAGGEFNILGGSNIELHGQLLGDGQLVKRGSGGLQLNNASSFEGILSVTEGTLAINGIMEHASIALSQGTTLYVQDSEIGSLSGEQGSTIVGTNLVINQTHDGIFDGNVDVWQTFTKSGNADLVLNGNIASGNIIVENGTLEIGPLAPNYYNSIEVTRSTSKFVSRDGAFGAGFIAGNGEIQAGQFGLALQQDTEFSGTITTSGDFNKAGQAKLTLTGTIIAGQAVIISEGDLQIGDGSTRGEIEADIQLNGGSLSFDRTDAFTFANAISGGSQINKYGTNDLTLSNLAAFGGQINIYTGVLTLEGSTNAYIVNHGATVSLNHAADASLVSVTSIGNHSRFIKKGIGRTHINSFGLAPGDELVISDGTLVVGNWNTQSGSQIVLDGGSLQTPSTVSATILVGSAGGKITGGRYFGNISGGGDLRLESVSISSSQNSNFFIGDVSFSGNSQLTGNALSVVNSVNLDSAILDINSSTTIRNLSSTGNSVLYRSGNLTLDNTRNTIFSGQLSGEFATSIIKIGQGTLDWQGGFYTRSLHIQEGGFRIGSPSYSSNIDDVIIGDSSTAFLELNSNLSIANLSGGGRVLLNDKVLSIIALPSSPPTTYTGNITGSGAISFGSYALWNFSGSLGNEVGLHIRLGTVNLSQGAGSGSGNITIESTGNLLTKGVVGRRVQSSGQIVATGNLIIGDPSSENGFASSGTLNLDHFSVTLLSTRKIDLQGSTQMANGSILNSQNGIELTGSLEAQGDGIIRGRFTNNGSVSGPTDGTLAFEGQVNGAGNFSGNVAFLGSYNPGNSPASISFAGDVSFGDFALLTMELGGLSAGIEYDQLIVEGSLQLGGSLVISLINGFSPTLNDSFVLFEASSITNSFTTIILPELNSGLYWDTTNLSSLGVIAVVPEASTLSMLGLGLAGLLLLRRKSQSI